MSSNLQNRKLYYFLLAFFAFAVFFFNQNHLNQDTIYIKHILSIAENVFKGAGYTNEAGKSEFYPIWGYVFLQLPGLIVGFPHLWTLFVQFCAAIIGLVLFYKLFEIKEKYWHIPLFLPYFALCSIKTADGLASILLIAYAYNFVAFVKTEELRKLVYSGLVLAVLVNLRSEYLYLPLFQTLFFFICFKNRLKYAKMNAILITITFAAILPWAIRSYAINQEVRFNSSNGGAVMYISLGQLPQNKWGIAPTDSTAYAIAAANGIDDPFSPEADKLFKRLTQEAILNNPFEFIKKMAYNATKVFTNGVYTGEYANFFLGKSVRSEIDRKINLYQSKIEQIRYLFNLPTNRSVPLLLEKFIQMVFAPIFFSLMIYQLYTFAIRKSRQNKIIMIVGMIIIFKILIISLIQYEYRHSTGFYLLLFGVFVYFLNNREILNNRKN